VIKISINGDDPWGSNTALVVLPFVRVEYYSCSVAVHVSGVIYAFRTFLLVSKRLEREFNLLHNF
jgi:hypothetical protein